MKQIKNAMLVVAGGMVILFAGSSCSKSSDTLPTIDGYNNSDEVAKDNLKAHWTFDDTYNEAISSAAPLNKYGTYAFATGQIGRALQLNPGAIVYPPIANINTANALSSYTVSMWVNTGNTGSFAQYFGLYPAENSDVWGNLSLGAEAGRHAAASDTLELKINYLSRKLDGTQDGQDNLATINAGPPPAGSYFLGANTWFHFVARWNPSDHNYSLFANGVSIGAYTNRGTATDLIMKVPCNPIFGSFGTQDVGIAGGVVRPDWSPMATVLIDDVRVFNAAISDANITALYNLGTAGR